MGHLLASNKMINIAIVNYNIYVLISTVLVVSFLSRVLKFNRISKMILFGAFFIIWIYDNFILNGIITTNSISRISSHTLIILLSFYTIKKRIEIYNFDIKNEPVFIIMIGLCFNSLFRIICEVIYLTNIPTKELNNTISVLIPIINFTLYSFFIYALICLKKPMKLISHY